VPETGDAHLSVPSFENALPRARIPPELRRSPAGLALRLQGDYNSAQPEIPYSALARILLHRAPAVGAFPMYSDQNGITRGRPVTKSACQRKHADAGTRWKHSATMCVKSSPDIGFGTVAAVPLRRNGGLGRIRIQM